MLARINFPREAILLSGVGQVFFGFLIRLVLLIGVFVWFQIVPPTTVLLFPMGIVSLVLIGFMLGVLLVPLGLLYSDVQQTIPIVTMLLMFLTPVLYPQPTHGIAGAIARWNPLTPLVMTTRDWITTGNTTHLLSFAMVAVIALVCLFLGWVLYRLALPHIIARIGN
jgi:lipopolysaccharide transport system permease protein